MLKEAKAVVEQQNVVVSRGELHDNTGGIWLELFIYPGSYPEPRVEFMTKVVIRAQEPLQKNCYGPTIFDGSIGELIAKLAPVLSTPLDAAPELIVKG